MDWRRWRNRSVDRRTRGWSRGYVRRRNFWRGRGTGGSQKSEGTPVKLCAIQYTDKGAPPRAHYPVLAEDGTALGELTSGVLSPSLNIGIAMAYLPTPFAKLGTPVQIDVRGRRFPAIVVKKPFYKIK